MLKLIVLAAGAVLAQVVPSDVSRLPDVLGATNVGADAPLPRITLLAVSVVKLVPPLATGNAVPEYVIASVPLVVIGLPDIESTDGTVAATEVTEPEPLLLNVVQSVDDRYPSTEVVATGIDIAGVAPPLETTGLVPVTLVTVPLPLLLKVFQSVLVKYPSTEVVAAAILMAGVVPPDEATGAVPVTLVTVPEPLLLNVVQSVELKAPRLVAEAVGTCSVITGVVVLVATVEDKSVPVVPRVKAATEVTVPKVLFSIVIEPVELVIAIPVPAVRVVLVSVFPVVLPIKICPLV